MKIIKIQLEFLQGPIWYTDVETGETETGVAVVDNDLTVREINKQCADLFNSYYEFDSHDKPCWFNKEKEKADKEIMLALLEKLINRLNEINDGSFVIEDLETERVKNL